MVNDEIEQNEVESDQIEAVADVDSSEVAEEASADDSAEATASAGTDTDTDDSAAEETSAGAVVATAADGESEEEQASTLPQFANTNLRWYVVHTYSMYEDKAKMALEERIKQFDSEEQFGSILVPKTASQKVLKSGKKKTVSRTSFPGYILVQMELNDQTGHIVRDTPKITGFVGNAKKPRPVSDREVLRLTSPETIREEKQAAASNLTFEKGETIKVTDGAFTNFDGLVEQVMADKMKLRILVSIFGRETPVELDYGQVKKLT